MPEPTGHVDPFCIERLPPRELWPVRDWTGVPELAYPPRVNCAHELLDGALARGWGDRIAVRLPDGVPTVEGYYKSAELWPADSLARLKIAMS